MTKKTMRNTRRRFQVSERSLCSASNTELTGMLMGHSILVGWTEGIAVLGRHARHLRNLKAYLKPHACNFGVSIAQFRQRKGPRNTTTYINPAIPYPSNCEEMTKKTAAPGLGLSS